MGVIEKLIAALTGPLVQIVGQLIDKWGTKFIVACGAIGSIMYLLLQDKTVLPIWAWVVGIASIAVIAITYFYYRRQQETSQINTKQ